MKRCIALLLTLLITSNMTACRQTETAVDDSTWAFPAEFTGLEALVEEAQAEGELTVYGGCESAYLATVCETFEQLFNVRVTYQALDDEAVLAKLNKSRPGADVWFGADSAALEQAAEDGNLTAYVPTAAGNLSDSDFADSEGRWYGVAVDPLGLIVNTASLEKMGVDAPARWEDLTELKYWELLWLPSYDTTEGRLLAQAALKVYGDKAEKYLLELDENTLHYAESGDSAANYVGTGEAVVAVGLLSGGAAQRLDKGCEDISLLLPREGTPYALSGAAILRGAPHSAAAQLWMEFVLSSTGQALAAENGWYVWPTVSGVTLPEAFEQLNVKLSGLTDRLAQGEDAASPDSLIEAVQATLNPSEKAE